MDRSGSNPRRLNRVVIGDLVYLVGDAVHGFQEPEGFPHGNVPKKLGALSENHADVQRQLASFFPGHPAQNFQGAARGHDDSREHLEGRGFAGPVLADKAHPFPTLNGEGDVFNGLELLRLGGKKAFGRAQQGRVWRTRRL